VTPEVADYWARAIQALQTAESLVDRDPDASSSRAYYAAFYAVSALLASSSAPSPSTPPSSGRSIGIS
jgi:uncharacterized protein (UPF0332 family)